MTTVLFLNLGAGEVFLIFIVILMFFGSKSIPTLARGLGKGMREFRDAASGIQREIQNSIDEVRDSVDLTQEMNEINEAARRMTGDVQEGLDNINANLDPEKNLGDAEVFQNKQELNTAAENKTAETSAETAEITSTVNPETIADPVSTENKTNSNPDPAQPEGPPNTVIRKG